MPTSLIDSAVFRDIFSTEAMRRVFSDENRVQKYLDFEAALARASSCGTPFFDQKMKWKDVLPPMVARMSIRMSS